MTYFASCFSLYAGCLLYYSKLDFISFKKKLLCISWFPFVIGLLLAIQH
uniref:Uncharacterized protein n=1 Tax=Rhizophora mucronata TaxID=61149 RepID=A0A2P2ISF6_RHIMU